MEFLRETAHRPWALPSSPWIMRQKWHELLFAHYALDAARMRALVPPELELDLHDGVAWLGIVPFRMSGVAWRGVPALPGTSAFPEMNLRTYVTHGGKPGVWFFALDAANPLAVAVARAAFHLPYFLARMTCRRKGIALDSFVDYASERVAPHARARVRVRYGPRTPPRTSKPGSFEHWATARYCLYALDSARRVQRGEIHHAPWPLQDAWAEFEANELPSAHGFELGKTEPQLHYAERLDVVVWPLTRA